MLEEPIITETEDAVRIIVRANDFNRNFSVFGGTHQPKKQTIKITDGHGEVVETKVEDDPHYFAKGLSKAQRNALNLCIPGDYAARMIDRFLTLAGKQPLLTQQSESLKREPVSKPAKGQIKPRENWDTVTEDQVPNYPKLEVIIWNLVKIQPADMYKELGVSSRSDMTIPAWEAFLQLKERYAPKENEQ
jgi:hypothetical protein